MLLYLAVDYARKPELRQRFAANPQAVLAEYLSADEQAQLEGAHRDRTEQILRDEVEELIRILEALRSLDQIPDQFLWAAPLQPQVLKVSPATVVALTSVQLEISGQDFAPKVGVDFKAPGRSATLVAPVVNAAGTAITGSIVFREPGTYTCVVVNNPGSSDTSTGTLAQAITVTV